MKSRLSRIGYLLAALLGLALMTGAGAAYAAGMSVDPTYGGYGTVFSVSVDGLNPNERVSTWVGLSNGQTDGLGEVTADHTGSVDFDVTPQSSWPPGEVIVVAHGMSSGHEYSVKFTLAANHEDTSDNSSDQSSDTSSDSNTVSASADNRTVYYSASGYTAGERVSAWYQGPYEMSAKTSIPLSGMYADSAGNVSFSFTLPESSIFGGYQVTTQGWQSKRITYATFSYFGTITDERTYSVSHGTTATGEWWGQYFDNPDLSGSPVLERTDAAINFDWGWGSPSSLVPVDDFSVRWTSTQHISTAGNYLVTATADDGIRVWVDGHLVIDEWQDQPATTYYSTVYMNPGDHSVVVEYYERADRAVARVSLTAD